VQTLLLDDIAPMADPLARLSYRDTLATVAQFGRREAWDQAVAGWGPVVALSLGTSALTVGTVVIHSVPAQVVCALLALVAAAVTVSSWSTRSWEKPARDRLRSLTAYDPSRASIQIALAQDDVARACRAIRGGQLNMVFWRRSPSPPDAPGLDAVMMISTPLALPELDFDTLAERTHELCEREHIRTHV